MNDKRIYLAALAAILLFCALRYTITTTTGHGAYVLDRWTGRVTFCLPNGCRPVPDAPPYAKPAE